MDGNRTREKREIVQILPAVGWLAEYEDSAVSESGAIFREPVVCWALCNVANEDTEDTRQAVLPMLADEDFGADFADEACDYLQCVHESQGYAAGKVEGRNDE